MEESDEGDSAVEGSETRTLLRRRIQQTARMGPMRKCGNALG